MENISYNKNMGQEDFIDRKLEQLVVCDFDLQSVEKKIVPHALKDLSPSVVHNILTNRYTSGANMKAVLCLFNTLILASSSGKIKNGIHMVSSNIQEWIQGMQRMGAPGVSGYIYATHMISSEVEVVIKVPREITNLAGRNTHEAEAAMHRLLVAARREYFLGITVVNSLRYRLPSFVYTLGAFICAQPPSKGGSISSLCVKDSPESLFVVYEKIAGYSVKEMLVEKKWEFKEWLALFAQLLLGLEVAQREIQFTHYDLHDANVMVRKSVDYSKWSIEELRNGLRGRGASDAEAEETVIGLRQLTVRELKQQIRVINQDLTGSDVPKKDQLKIEGTKKILIQRISDYHFKIDLIARLTALSGPSNPYSVDIDDTTYHVRANGMCPVIIDFGLSTALVDNVNIGTTMGGAGINPFMVAGFDMYKFMVYSARHTPNAGTKDEILSIFEFYESSDPYKLYTRKLRVHQADLKTAERTVRAAMDSGLSEEAAAARLALRRVKTDLAAEKAAQDNQLLKATREYCRDVIHHPAASCTPLMLYKWIALRYPDVLASVITQSSRHQYLQLQYSNTLQEYDAMFGLKAEGRDKAITTVINCIKPVPSYIMLMYHLYLLRGYNKTLLSQRISAHIATLRSCLKISTELIEGDKKILEKVFTVIALPDAAKFEKGCAEVLGTRIRHPEPLGKKNRVGALKKMMTYRHELQPYLQFYYTILELHLEKTFDVWIRKFRSSAIFKFNEKYSLLAERASRWGETLVASIHTGSR